MNITQEGEEQSKKQHPDLIYIPEQDTYKLKNSKFHIWYPSVEVYEENKRICQEMQNEWFNKVAWKKNL